MSEDSADRLVVPVYMGTAVPIFPLDAPDPDDAILSNRILHE